MIWTIKDILAFHCQEINSFQPIDIPVESMNKGDIFFIIGIPRSGTTLLEQMLDSHSAIAVCPEIFTGKTIWKARAENQIDHLKKTMVANDLFNHGKVFNDVINGCIALAGMHKIQSKMQIQAWYDIIINQYLKLNNAVLFGEKTPENLYQLSTLQHVWPDAKYIFIQRNPYDVILSLCEAGRQNNEKPIDNNLLLEKAIFVKIGLPIIAAFRKKKMENHLFIEYKNLVSNPEQTLSDVCQFLGVEFEENMLHFQNKKIYRERISIMNAIHKNLNEPVTDSRLNRAFSILSKEQLSVIFNYLSPELTTYPEVFSIPLIQLPLNVKWKIGLAKLKFKMGLHLLPEIINKLKLDVKYWLLYNCGNSKISRKIFEKYNSSESDWKKAVDQLK